MSLSNMPPNGAAMICVNSTILIPSSGPGILFPYQWFRENMMLLCICQGNAERNMTTRTNWHSDHPPACTCAECHEWKMFKGTRKIGRNEKCPCGSGSKFKKCHGSANR
ncbi:MAG: hypothetical protein CL795_01480 [Chloroflexi bacterium]|nr:hypothetical protein [Chloroflexota bacterium]